MSVSYTCIHDPEKDKRSQPSRLRRTRTTGARWSEDLPASDCPKQRAL